MAKLNFKQITDKAYVSIIENGTNSREISQATRRCEKLVKQLKEARDYDAKIAHAALSRMVFDLEDGVKFNYEKVQKGQAERALEFWRR